MFCAKCGNQLLEGMAFCQICGEKIAPVPDKRINNQKSVSDDDDRKTMALAYTDSVIANANSLMENANAASVMASANAVSANANDVSINDNVAEDNGKRKKGIRPHLVLHIILDVIIIALFIFNFTGFAINMAWIDSNAIDNAWDSLAILYGHIIYWM